MHTEESSVKKSQIKQEKKNIQERNDRNKIKKRKRRKKEEEKIMGDNFFGQGLSRSRTPTTVA